MTANQIKQVAEFLRESKRILFITGAGLSADSGMPTYRGIGGLYGDLPVRDGLTIEDILSGYTMRKNPELVWEYICQLTDAFLQAKPNRGHEVIAAMGAHFPQLLVLTQNVDGFHTQAGSTNVIDIHGDIHDVACMHCDYRANSQDLGTLVLPPKCPECKGFLRPDVILFGEMLDQNNLTRLQEALFVGFDLVFSVGTSSLFPYITQPVFAIGQRGGKTVEINPGTTDLSSVVDVKICANAAPTLEAIWREYLGK